MTYFDVSDRYNAQLEMSRVARKNSVHHVTLPAKSYEPEKSSKFSKGGNGLTWGQLILGVMSFGIYFLMIKRNRVAAPSRPLKTNQRLTQTESLRAS